MRLKWRISNGEFSHPPSLEAEGMVKVCVDKTCGQLLLKTTDYSRGYARGKFPDVCPRCGKTQNDQAHPTAARATVDGTENL